jgi:hypothetical protein
MSISPSLDQDVEDITILVNGAPQVVSLAPDGREDLVKEPGVAESNLPPPKILSVVQAELPAPESDRLIRDGDPSLCQKVFHIAEAQAEAMV